MAKNNINLGTLVGKLGDNIFWRTKGQQRIRAYYKRTLTQIGERQANAQSKYANALAVYQYLPDAFRRACDSFRTGETSFSNFMKQTKSVSLFMHKGRSGFGRFDVMCHGEYYNVSMGTLAIDTDIKEIVHVNIDSNQRTLIAVTALFYAVSGLTTIAEISNELLSKNNYLREGDILHFLTGYATYESQGWHGPFSPSLAPSPWLIRTYGYIQLSKTNTASATTTLGEVLLHPHRYGGVDMLAFGSYNNLREQAVTAETDDNMVAAFMIERPSNFRSMRFTRSRLDVYVQCVEGDNDYARYADECVDSYVKTT